VVAKATFAALFNVFSDVCVKHDPTAGSHKGVEDDRCLSSEVHFHSLLVFCASGISLVHVEQ